jgi:hypothetical protein
MTGLYYSFKSLTIQNDLVLKFTNPNQFTHKITNHALFLRDLSIIAPSDCTLLETSTSIDSSVAFLQCLSIQSGP